MDNQRSCVLNRYRDETQRRIFSRRGHLRRLIKETLLEEYITYLISMQCILITLRQDFRTTHDDYIFPKLGKNI